MQKIRVGVVRGGPSSEYAISLKTGENVLKNLDTGKYAPIDILLTTRGDWYVRGVRTDLGTIAEHVDIVWNALHGAYGEDGKVQRLFKSFGILYTGSDVLGSAIGMHKGLAKERFREAGLRTPEGVIATRTSNLDDIMPALIKSPNLRPPIIVKPVFGGSSVAPRIVRNIPELEEAIELMGRYGDVLLEEYIAGKGAMVCVVDGSAMGERIALFPAETIPYTTGAFYDSDIKREGGSQIICQSNFTTSACDELRSLAVKAHQAIGARHYSQTNFIVSSNGIYVLEINTLPRLDVLFSSALEKGGVEFSEFLDHVIELSLAGK
ncbi:MAG: ATP-grasp domain-containing protein [Patescibacteria group bacterium]